MSEILQPREIDLSDGLCSTFGKAEVEEAACRLVKFFQERRGLWQSFTFVELEVFYASKRWKPNEMLFGLFGPWYDDGGTGHIQNPPDYVIHFGEVLATTELFQQKCSRNTLHARLLVSHRKPTKEERDYGLSLDRYRWRSISELHEDYGTCLLLDVNDEDGNNLALGSNLDVGFDEKKWTHFSPITPLSQEEAERLRKQMK